jgi:glutamate racemase
VPLVEEGILGGEMVENIIKMYLEKFRQNKIDTIILGCTHYPLLKKEIASFLKGVKIIDSAREVALHTKDTLYENGILSGRHNPGQRQFYVTDEPKGFMKLAKLFLNRDIPKPKIINV